MQKFQQFVSIVLKLGATMSLIAASYALWIGAETVENEAHHRACLLEAQTKLTWAEVAAKNAAAKLAAEQAAAQPTLSEFLKRPRDPKLDLVVIGEKVGITLRSTSTRYESVEDLLDQLLEQSELQTVGILLFKEGGEVEQQSKEVARRLRHAGLTVVHL